MVCWQGGCGKSVQGTECTVLDDGLGTCGGCRSALSSREMAAEVDSSERLLREAWQA
eukprot:COSAG02_NODE_51251_length_315_cov_0.805556_1_plen_56_part_10